MPKILEPGEEKVLFNCRVDPDLVARMKLICVRRSIHKKKKISEGAFIETSIKKTPMPKKPTQEQIDEYLRLNPKHREAVEEILAKSPP